MIPWMKRARLLALFLLSLPGCARSAPGTVTGAAPAPTLRLGQAVVALDSGQYAAAVQALRGLAESYPQHAVGREALLLAAAAQLDPRNAQGQLDQGAALLTQYLAEADTSDWTRPVAGTLYLLALQVGAAQQQAEAEAARARAEAVPRLPGPSLSARLLDLQQQRDRLAGRVKELEAGTAQLQKQLADTVQELKRIRRTLRP